MTLAKAQMWTWTPAALWLGQERTQYEARLTLAESEGSLFSRQAFEPRNKGDLRPGLAVLYVG